MFTGIIEEVGTIVEAGQNHLGVRAAKVLEGLAVGDSVSVNGVCLTAKTVTHMGFSVDVMPVTLRRSNLGKLGQGDGVNLERGMVAGGRIGGHFVQGHVDDVASVVSLTSEEGSVIMRVGVSSVLSRYIVGKGFIAVDGVSLTVVEIDDTYFEVSLVNFTKQTTTLGQKHPGDTVNLEVDIMAKYIESVSRPASRGVTFDFLKEHGF